MSQSYSSNCFSTAAIIQTDMQNIENNFDALRSLFSGSSAPASPDDGQWWYDNSTVSMLKIRYNSSWVNVWDMANQRVAAGQVKTDSLAAGIFSTDSTGRAKMANGYITNAHVADVDVTKVTNLNKSAVVMTGPRILSGTSAGSSASWYGITEATVDSTFILGRTYLPNTGANKLKMSYGTASISGGTITIICGTSAVVLATPGGGAGVMGDGTTYIDATAWLGSAQTITLRIKSGVAGQAFALESYSLYLTT